VIFEPGVIKVEKEREFGELKAAIEKAFSADGVTKYLKALDRGGIRVRDLDAAFASDAIDRANGEKTGTARSLHEALPVSDRSQVREFYLSKVEEVDPALRAKFHKLYQYY
jgi:hypothetical protein